MRANGGAHLHGEEGQNAAARAHITDHLVMSSASKESSQGFVYLALPAKSDGLLVMARWYVNVRA